MRGQSFFALTLKRIGWTVHSATEWISDFGMPINLELLSPAVVQSLVCEAVQRWRWKQVAVKLPALENPGGHAGAWIAPIRNVLARKDNDTWNHAHKGALNQPWQTDSGHNNVCTRPACLTPTCASCVLAVNMVTKWVRICTVSSALSPSIKCVNWPPVGSVTCWTISMAASHQSNTVLRSVV